ncbi:hypothetical protein HK101_002242 [Irineochytrium annulatum]|nr:hypothetical protein HK101_002242 [Irineochytrium annulatum]
MFSTPILLTALLAAASAQQLMPEGVKIVNGAVVANKAQVNPQPAAPAGGYNPLPGYSIGVPANAQPVKPLASSTMMVVKAATSSTAKVATSAMTSAKIGQATAAAVPKPATVAMMTSAVKPMTTQAVMTQPAMKMPNATVPVAVPMAGAAVPVMNAPGVIPTGIVTSTNGMGVTIITDYNPTGQNLAMDDWFCEDVVDDNLVCSDALPTDNLAATHVCFEAYDDFVDFDCVDDLVDSWSCDYEPFLPQVAPKPLPGAMAGGDMMGGMGGGTGAMGGMPGAVSSGVAAVNTMGPNGQIGVTAGASRSATGAVSAFAAVMAVALLL